MTEDYTVISLFIILLRAVAVVYAGPLRVKKATILQLAAKCGVSSFCGAAAGVVISSLSFFFSPLGSLISASTCCLTLKEMGIYP
jgi:hypothetical protein